MKFRGNLTDSNPPTPQRWPGLVTGQQAGAGGGQRPMVTSPTGQTSSSSSESLTTHLPSHCRSRSETHLTEKNFDRLVLVFLVLVFLLAPSGAQGVTIFVRLSDESLSRALNLYLSGLGLSQVTLGSLLSLSQLFLLDRYLQDL